MPSMIRLLSAVCLFLLAVEGAARLDDLMKFGAPFWQEYSAEQLRSVDSDGVRCNVPHARFEKWRNNSLGFRGPEIGRDKPAGVTRVVCFGVSETYGLYETPDREWPAQVRGLLPGSRFEVVNAASAGLGFPQYPAYLTKHVLPIRPDIIVILVNPSSAFLASERAAAPRKRSGESAARSFGTVVADNVRALPKVKQAMLGALEKEFPSVVKGYARRNVAAQVRESERYRLRGRAPRDTVPDEYLDRFRHHLAAVVTSLRSEGITVILTTYPSVVSRDNLAVYPELIDSLRIFCPELSPAGLADAFSRVNGVIPRVAAETGALFVDGAATIPNNTDYFADAVHYRDRGARLLAETMAVAILDAAPQRPGTGQRGSSTP